MGIIYKESVYIASVKINSRRRSNIFFKPIRISRSSHSTTTIKLRFSSFHSLPPPLLSGERQIFGSLANLFPPRSKRRRRRRPRASRQEASRQARTRWGLDPPRLFLHSTRRSTWRRSWTSIFAPRLPLKPPWFIFRSTRGILSSERRIQCLCIFLTFITSSKRLSLDFFFFVRKERRNRRWVRNWIYFFSLLDLSIRYNIISFRREEFFLSFTRIDY